MKKLAVVLSSNPQTGGGYQYALIVAECLKQISEKASFKLIAICNNNEWCIWCRKNHIEYYILTGISYTIDKVKFNIKHPIYSRIYSMYGTELGKLIKREKIDVLFYTNQMEFIPNLDVEIITPVHDLMHRYEPTFPEVRIDFEKREAIFKCQAKYADYILVDSKIGKNQFEESYVKYTKRKPNVISLPFIVPEHIYNTKEDALDVPDKYVFYPAQFWKHKNHINLIKAIQILKDDMEDIRLVLVGSEKNCYQEIKNYIKLNSLEKYIIMLGFVSNENMTYLYKHATGMIMPSYFGPTNIPPLEAMAMGCPVAVSNKYAMPEQVGNAGLLFNPDSPYEIANCIKRIWTDSELRENMIKLGYKKINMWSKDNFQKRLFKIIKSIFNLI